MCDKNRTTSVPALILGAVFAMSFAGSVTAQSAMPAELPPSDFGGVEYVDSTGCVFARIDVGDRVEWVPRVGPDRQQLCGLEPSVSVAAAPVIEPTPEPVIETATPSPAHTQPRTAMRSTASATVPPQPVVHAAVAQLVPAQILLPDTVDAADVSLRAPCADPASIAAQYLENSIVPPCTTAAAPSPDLVYGTDHPRPRPNHSAVARLRVDHATPPRGYRNVWTDGRLNPYRGIRTVEGEAQMRMVWTNTVPRRLVPAE